MKADTIMVVNCEAGARWTVPSWSVTQVCFWGCVLPVRLQMDVLEVRRRFQKQRTLLPGPFCSDSMQHSARWCAEYTAQRWWLSHLPLIASSEYRLHGRLGVQSIVYPMPPATCRKEPDPRTLAFHQ